MFDASVPHDPSDQIAYLTDLRDRGVVEMRQNRGKLIDAHGRDRSDLIPYENDGDMRPMLPQQMEMTRAHLEELIHKAHEKLPSEYPV